MAANIYGTVLIGGGSGFIGSHLRNALKSIGVNAIIISRHSAPETITWHDLENNGLPPDTGAVVNVSGQNVLDPKKRWNDAFKQNVITSRVNTTKSLATLIANSKHKPKVFVTISGVGYYKPSLTHEYTEESSGGDSDFLSELCRDWEDASLLPKELGVRNVIIRSGVVLGGDGGIIKQLFLPFYLGLGGPIGSGKQYMPWIHVDDLVGMFMFAIEEDHVTGVLNGVAPQAITNYEFTKSLGRVMWRPTLIPIPAFVLNFLFSPERAVMMTEGQRVIPKRVQQLGFKYLFNDIDLALKDIY